MLTTIQDQIQLGVLYFTPWGADKENPAQKCGENRLDISFAAAAGRVIAGLEYQALWAFDGHLQELGLGRIPERAKIIVQGHEFFRPTTNQAACGDR